ncbi:MAG: flavodoxin family protein [Pseudomonadota bacterium]
MKIVGILGSPRKKGNTEILLDVAMEEARKNGVQFSKIPLRGKVIGHCNGCQKCMKTGKCVIKDDMQEIYQEMLDADGILWATPVYCWSMTSLAKTVMDRTYALTVPRVQLTNKIGGLIVVAARRGCLNTAQLFQMYFNYNHMFFSEYAWGHALEKGEIRKDPLAVNMVKEMVRQMISLIQANLKFPEEFDRPLHRFVINKYPLS